MIILSKQSDQLVHDTPDNNNEVNPAVAEKQERNHQLSSDSQEVQSMPQVNNVVTDPNCAAMNGEDQSAEEGAANAVCPEANDMNAEENGDSNAQGSNKQPQEDIPVNPYNAPPMESQLDPEELIRQLVHQLEYYFSNENLQQDPFLLSQMNGDHYVSIDVLANFNAIKKLTRDVSLVTEALRASPFVEVDQTGEKVRPNQRKCILMLRDIAGTTPPADVVGLFEGHNCPKVMSCEFAGNSNWYIMFENETDAYAAYQHLRENVREFQGKPIMARFKLKTHHLNTYSCQAMASNTRVPKENTPVSTPQMPQQVTSPPVDYNIPPQHQPLLLCQPHFQTSGHPATHMGPPPFIARVAAPTTGNGPVPTSAMAVSSHFNGFVVPSPWQHANFYPGSDAPIMAPQIAAGQFLPNTNFKPAQLHQSVSGNNKPSSYSGGHRFTEFHKEVNHRTSYNQRKSSTGSYSQSQQPNNMQRYVVSNDPNPPTVMPEMLGQFVHSEQPSTQAHSIPNPRHYLPAVNAIRTAAPFVTPNVSDPGIVVLQPQHHMAVLQGVPPHVAQQRRGQTPSMHNSQRSTTSGNPVTHQPNTSTSSSSSYRMRYSNTSRSSNSYTAEISPRFIAKGAGNLPFQSGAYGYQQNMSYPPHKSTAASAHPNQDYQMAFTHRHMNGVYTPHYPPNRTRNSPPTDDKEYSGDGMRPQSAMNHRGNAGSVNSSSNNVSASNEQRNSHQGGLEQRRNNPRNRRARRNDDDRASHATPLPIGNTPFTLESNSFPPLPGVPETSVAPSNPANECTRPAAADVVKGLETVKISSQETTQPSIPPKKYSEVSSATSHTSKTPSQVSHQQKPVVVESSQASKGKVENKPKPISAVNTQPVADKHPPSQNKRSYAKQSAPEKVQPNTDSPKPESSNRTNSASNSSKKSSATSSAVIQKDSKKSVEIHKNETAAKSEAASKSDKNNNPSSKNSGDANVTSSEIKEVPKDGAGSDDLNSTTTDTNGRKPTYAEMLKMQKDAAAAAQMNGKAMSESEKSESGDDSRSGDEVRDPELKTSLESKPESKTSSKRVEKDNESVATEKREVVSNGNHRRSDHEYNRRPWNNNRYRDGHDNYRGNRSWYGNDRGPRDNRGRGGGYRGRRGGYRDQRYYNNGGGRPVPNGQVPPER